jgi:hypothetical protein
MLEPVGAYETERFTAPTSFPRLVLPAIQHYLSATYPSDAEKPNRLTARRFLSGVQSEAWSATHKTALLSLLRAWQQEPNSRVSPATSMDATIRIFDRPLLDALLTSFRSNNTPPVSAKRIVKACHCLQNRSSTRCG